MMVIDATPEIAPVFWAMLSLLAISGFSIAVPPMWGRLARNRAGGKAATRTDARARTGSSGRPLIAAG